jgi:Putative peptidoglycan binding domain
MEVFVDRKQFLKRALLIGLISALPAAVNAAPPGGGGHSGGGSQGGHSMGGGGHAAFGGRGAFRSAGYMHNYRFAYAGNANSWHGNGGSWHGNGGSWHGNGGSWHGNGSSWHGNGDWRRHGEGEEHERHHHRFSFGFFPYWYPGWGYYDYGYYGYPYYSYDYPDYYYPDSASYSGRNGSASIPVLVQDSLARRGYYAGPVDGVVGSGTRSAIREFQRDNGLPVTGRIDSQLVQALQIGRD